jgi:protein-S-isoprenylcysteine O-methyltransferase Ste14
MDDAAMSDERRVDRYLPMTRRREDAGQPDPRPAPFKGSPMIFFTVLYGGAAYLTSFAAILYLIAFVGDLPVPRTIDSGTTGSLPAAVAIDLLLIGLFAVQHSVMARPAFKRLWTRLVPPAIERSTYVLFASLALVLLFWLWRPIAGVVWSATDPIAVAVLQAGFWAGWGLVLLSTFLINHFELFGLQQVYARWRGSKLPPPEFKTPSLYKWVRHPLYLGLLIAMWATPMMTPGHLLFAMANTGYVLLGVSFEERDLVAAFGDHYRRYRERVSMLVPLPRRKAEPRGEVHRP